MRFDSDFVERVRNSNDIVELIGNYVRLRKSGQNFSALCPFHSEKTPSFLVSQSKQIFKCFGCGAGGDAFKFIQQIENLTFPEAIAHLAERTGIALPDTGPEQRDRTEKRTRLLKIMALADNWFRECLESNVRAQDYLSERQIGQETIEKFGIGYAPQGQDLLDLLRSNQFSESEAEACGLVNKNESGEYYPKFRSRITFPIRDLTGRTIAFGGRILGDGKPKYLNSPETLLYNKGSNLYGLSATRDEIRRRDFSVLVEGYFDCIVPFQFGIKNIVASLGTGLTEGQIKLLGRYTRNVIVNYDPDSAGVTAAIRSVDLFVEQGFHVNVVQLPAGQDPDSFILEHGSESYLEHLKSSLPYLEFLLNHFLAEQRDPHSPKAKREISAKILPYVARIPNRIERAEHIARLANRLRIDEGLLVSELRKFSGRGSRQAPLDLTQLHAAPTIAERTLLSAVLVPSTQAYVLSLLEPSLLEGLSTEKIFKGILELWNQNEEISVIKIRTLIDEDEVETYDSLLISTPEVLLSEDEIQNSVNAIRDLQLDRLSREIQGEIAKEEQQGQASDRLNELLVRKEEIARQRHR